MRWTLRRYAAGAMVRHGGRTWEFAPRAPAALMTAAASAASSAEAPAVAPGAAWGGVLLERCFADVEASMLWVRPADAPHKAEKAHSIELIDEFIPLRTRQQPSREMSQKLNLGGLFCLRRPRRSGSGWR